VDVGDRADQGKAFNHLGSCYGGLVQNDKAIKLYQKCLTIEEEMVDRAGQASACCNLGVCYEALQ